MNTKGLILAGGKGTRLYPMTAVFSKQLMPVYDKPMIYYPLAVLMLGGIRDIALISTPHDTPRFAELLGDGSQWGINISYIVQPVPGGLPQAFILGKDFIGNDQSTLILGDNLFYGKLDFFRRGLTSNQGGTVFAYRVDNPSDYGVIEFDNNGKVLSIEEKPLIPKSKFAIPGLYIFDSDVCQAAENLKPSGRGELEITDIHKYYLANSKLRAEQIGRGIAWLDTGTPENMVEACNFIMAIEKRQGTKIACLEEIALLMKFISHSDYDKTVDALPECDYKRYCKKVLEYI